MHPRNRVAARDVRHGCGRIIAVGTAGQGAAHGQGRPADDGANLVLPDANATPDEVDAGLVADAVKTALAAALSGVAKTDINVRSITKTNITRLGGGSWTRACKAVASMRQRLDDDGSAVDYIISS